MNKNVSKVSELLNIYNQKIKKIINVLSVEIKELILDFKNIFKSDDKTSLKLNNFLNRLRKTSLPFKFTTISIVIFVIFLSSGQNLTSRQVIEGLKSGKYHVIASSESNDSEIKKCSQAKLEKYLTNQLTIYNFTNGSLNGEIFWRGFGRANGDPHHNPYSRLRNKIKIEDTTYVKNGNRLMLFTNTGKEVWKIGELCLFDSYPYPMEKMRSGKPIELNYYSKKKGCPKPDFRINPLIGIQNSTGNAFSNWRFKGINNNGNSLILNWSIPPYRAISQVTLRDNDEISILSHTNNPRLKGNGILYNGTFYPCYDD